MTREEAITRLKNMAWLDGSVEREQTIEAIYMAIEALTAEPKTGEWMPIIEENEFGEPYQTGIYCSECGETLGCEANFCPNCGANMGVTK